MPLAALRWCIGSKIAWRLMKGDEALRSDHRKANAPASGFWFRAGVLGFFANLALWVWITGNFSLFIGEKRLWWLVIAISLTVSLPALVWALLVRRRWSIAAYLATAALALVLVASPWHPRLRFIHALEALSPGITVAQVQTRMANYEGGFLPPDESAVDFDGSLVYGWNREDGDYNADVGHVVFESGRLVATGFSPD